MVAIKIPNRDKWQCLVTLLGWVIFLSFGSIKKIACLNAAPAALQSMGKMFLTALSVMAAVMVFAVLTVLYYCYVGWKRDKEEEEEEEEEKGGRRNKRRQEIA